MPKQQGSKKKYSIALIEGDGVGPEISKASLLVLDALEDKLGLGFSVVESPAGDNCKKKTGVPLPDSSLKSIRESDACLKAPVGETAADVIVKLRQMLDLYANIRPAKSLPNVPSLKPGIDMVIVRENTDGPLQGAGVRLPGRGGRTQNDNQGSLREDSKVRVRDGHAEGRRSKGRRSPQVERPQEERRPVCAGLQRRFQGLPEGLLQRDAGGLGGDEPDQGTRYPSTS